MSLCLIKGTSSSRRHVDFSFYFPSGGLPRAKRVRGCEGNRSKGPKHKDANLQQSFLSSLKEKKMEPVGAIDGQTGGE